jgi:indole-3-glycerol phosphate synthase
MSTYLSAIVEAHRFDASNDTRDIRALERAAMSLSPVRGFAAALEMPGLSVIAEVKRRSPSKGDLALDLDPAGVAVGYVDGGARAISVLTDAAFFGAQSGDLEAVRISVPVPVLRKDFTVCERDIYDARLMGADALLLIVAALSDSELSGFHQIALGVGLDVLVEVHDEAELERALGSGAQIIGVNQRDLHTFEVDTNRAVRVGSLIPSSCIAVAESGIRGHDDAQLLAEAGFDAVLVGESVVTASDPCGAVRSLSGFAVSSRGGKS